MNSFPDAARIASTALLLALTGVVGNARADDVPSPCTALKRIVSASPDGFSTLTPEDGHGIARPDGSNPQCGAANRTYRCEWTPRQGTGTVSDAVEGVAADIASCLPDATHDVNSPARQHFYLGNRGNRTQITVTTADGGRIALVVSGH
ncbi:MAG TPA: hypothetical protein VGG24_08995 [Paraburkholderia sp.]|jgi:hypothetical protein